MDLDFALILTVAVIVTGVIWGFDLLLLKPKRTARAEAAVAELKKQGGDNVHVSVVNDTVAREMREPLLIEYAHSFFPVLLVVWALRSFLVEPFTIPSGSMLPTLEVGDYILVNKFAYGLRLPVLGTQIIPVGKPQRGDVMVFRYPEDPSVNFIKRVIGLPGDHVRVRNGQLIINGTPVAKVLTGQEPADSPWELYYRETLGTVQHQIRHEAGREAMGPENEWVVPDSSYFMMGDNRDNSRDSRYWGFVPDRLIVGKASFIWMHKQPGLHLPAFDRDGKVR